MSANEENMAKSPLAKELGIFPSSRHDDTEYYRTLEVSKAPDMFPCKHNFCHHCVRKYVRRNMYGSTIRCPLCGCTVEFEIPNEGPAVAYEDNSNAMLVTNFDEIVQKFNGIDRNIRRLKEESVQTSTIGMTYTSVPCDMCEEDHGTLKVLQEMNRLSVVHNRPEQLNGRYYRLSMGDVVTTFQSKVNSSCICVPCTYSGMMKKQHLNAHPELTYDPEDVSTNQCLAEVGKMIVQKSAPVVCMEGKNMIEVDHRISVKNRADYFNMAYTTNKIQKMIRQQEVSLIRTVSRQIRDNGRLYHVQESNAIEFDDMKPRTTDINGNDPPSKQLEVGEIIQAPQKFGFRATGYTQEQEIW